MKRALWFCLMAVLLVFSLLLAACVSPEGLPVPPVTPQVTPEKPPEAPEIYPVPRAQAVVVDTDTTYVTFDCANLFIPGGNQWGSGYHQVVNEWSWYINYATGEEILWRITGWDYDDNFQTFTLHVREGVTWNDGEPFTAEDIVFTVNMLLENPDLAGHAVAAEWVESAEAVDDLTAVIRLKKPNPRFHHNFRMWGGPLGQTVAKHVWEGKDPTTFCNWPPVETGPYKLQGVYPDLNLFVWERREDYWAKDLGFFPAPKYVIYRMAPPPDINLREVIEGQTDAPLPHIFHWDMVQAARAVTSDIAIAPFLDPNPVGVYGFNVKNPVLANREARWAIAYLLNREKLAELYPTAEKSEPSPYPWPAPKWAALDRFVPMAERALQRLKEEYGFTFEYNPERAAELFDELGYKLQDGVRVTPEGEPLSFVLLTRPATLLEEFYIAEDLAAELRKIGIDATIRSVDPGAYSDTIRDGAFDIAMGWIEAVPSAFAGDIAVGINTNYIWREAEVKADPLKDWLLLSNPELESVVEKLMMMEPDDPAAEPLYEEAIYLWMRDLWAVPAVEKAFVQTFSTRYWTGWPTAENMWHVPYNWWPEFQFVLMGIEPAAR